MRLKRANSHMPPERYDEHWIAFRLQRSVPGPNGCILWTGFIANNGYALSTYHSRAVRVHRQMLILKLGRPLKPGYDACHTCDVRHCINADHLWEGTRKQNMEDCLEKRRHDSQKRTHCPRGHEYTPENTHIRGPSTNRPNGARACIICMKARHRLRAGWPAELAYTLPPQPGRRPIECYPVNQGTEHKP